MTDVELLVARLRSEGNSKVHSILLVHKTLGIEITEAKALVHYSETWSDHRAGDEAFHDRLEEAIRESRSES